MTHVNAFRFYPVFFHSDSHRLKSTFPGVRSVNDKGLSVSAATSQILRNTLISAADISSERPKPFLIYPAFKSDPSIPSISSAIRRCLIAFESLGVKVCRIGIVSVIARTANDLYPAASGKLPDFIWVIIYSANRCMSHPKKSLTAGFLNSSSSLISSSRSSFPKYSLSVQLQVDVLR